MTPYTRSTRRRQLQGAKQYLCQYSGYHTIQPQPAALDSISQGVEPLQKLKVAAAPFMVFPALCIVHMGRGRLINNQPLSSCLF